MMQRYESEQNKFLTAYRDFIGVSEGRWMPQLMIFQSIRFCSITHNIIILLRFLLCYVVCCDVFQNSEYVCKYVI